jgi:GH15 family glucan-1,4-alpha-glucosidase
LESGKYQPIENHGVVGDLYTVALIGMDGSIDFMCFPNFDSPTIFARLLDAEKGGSFQLAPVMEGAGQRQLYLPDTNILLTRFLSTAGVAEISDFMPVEKEQPLHDLVRRAKTVRGEIRYRMLCKPAFDYARASHRVHLEDNHAIFMSDGPLKLQLRLMMLLYQNLHWVQGRLRLLCWRRIVQEINLLPHPRILFLYLSKKR